MPEMAACPSIFASHAANNSTRKCGFASGSYFSDFIRKMNFPVQVWGSQRFIKSFNGMAGSYG